MRPTFLHGRGWNYLAGVTWPHGRFLVGCRAQQAQAWQLGVKREKEAPLQGLGVCRVGFSVLAPQVTRGEASNLGAHPCLFLVCDLG